jgi:hypothetical protein
VAVSFETNAVHRTIYFGGTDSAARLWRLRICKKKTPLGYPIAYEIAFKERYSPTPGQAISLANTILDVELGD